MIKNYFKIAWRNAYRNRAQALINLFGLTLGMTCVMLIALFIKNEYQYDRHFADADRIFRVNINGKMGEEEFYAGYTPPPAGKTLLANFPEIESYARVYRPGQKIVRSGQDAHKRSDSTNRVYLGSTPIFCKCSPIHCDMVSVPRVCQTHIALYLPKPRPANTSVTPTRWGRRCLLRATSNPIS